MAIKFEVPHVRPSLATWGSFLDHHAYALFVSSVSLFDATVDPVPYSFTAIPSAFILRYMWLRSSPSASAVRLTLPWFSSSFFRM